MYDVQTQSSTGNVHNSGSNPLTVNVTVPTGRIPVSAGVELTSGSYTQDRGYLLGSYKSAADTWTFKFANNNSGSSQTYSCHVYHVPESETVEVLRVKP